MGGSIAQYSCSSSIDSCSHVNHPLLSATSSSSSSSSCNLLDDAVDENNKLSYDPAECDVRRDLSTDLRLGLSISPNSHNHLSSAFASTESTQRKLQRSDWPPIKSLLRSTLAGKAENRLHHASLFVKVYMEGIPIGRKLDLFAHDGYDSLIPILSHMFKATILYPDTDRVHSDKHHVLTYEDKDGDWMMVGDVPWEMFLSSVKRLKITRADRC